MSNEMGEVREKLGRLLEGQERQERQTAEIFDKVNSLQANGCAKGEADRARIERIEKHLNGAIASSTGGWALAGKTWKASLPALILAALVVTVAIVAIVRSEGTRQMLADIVNARTASGRAGVGVP